MSKHDRWTPVIGTVGAVLTVGAFIWLLFVVWDRLESDRPSSAYPVSCETSTTLQLRAVLTTSGQVASALVPVTTSECVWVTPTPEPGA